MRQCNLSGMQCLRCASLPGRENGVPRREAAPATGHLGWRGRPPARPLHPPTCLRSPVPVWSTVPCPVRGRGTCLRSLYFFQPRCFSQVHFLPIRTLGLRTYNPFSRYMANMNRNVEQKAFIISQFLKKKNNSDPKHSP